jgi:hypothetical protein
MRTSPGAVAPPPAALDAELARELWQLSAELTGLKPDRSGANVSGSNE